MALTADFEAGVDNATITTGAGEASASKWDVVFNIPTYQNTQAAHGTLSGFFNIGDRCVWNASASEHYGRVYMYATANPTGGTPHFGRVSSSTNETGDILVYMVVNTSGQLVFADVAAGHLMTFTNAIALNQWVRIEYHIIHNSGSGQVEAKLFNDAESETPTEEKSSTANWFTGTGMASISFGYHQDGTWSVYLDDIVADATDWVGPYTAPTQTLLASADSVDGAWTDQAGGTSLAAAIDEATFDDADYIRSDLNPSASGCRVKLSAGGDPHLSTDHVINWRTGKIGSATINMTVKLYQGGGDTLGAGTLIATFDRNNVGALTTYEETLSGGEADSITDYTDLYLEFFADTA